MSISALSKYTFQSRYARYNKKKKRRENWEEAVARVYDMHRIKYAAQIAAYPELDKMITFAQEMQTKKRVLAAQRSLQFAGDPIFKHELKMYNCLTTHIDREKVFSEILYALLCGCGVGFSVQKQHVAKLPNIVTAHPTRKTKYVIADSIEGWADALGVLIASFLNKSSHYNDYVNSDVEFDYSLIRPEGTLIAGQFKAPGSSGLEAAIEKIRQLILRRISFNQLDNKKSEFKNKLRPIDCYDIIMHASDAVLSGGVRRSATICLFSIDDPEMMSAKTGNWFVTDPQRARSNNSVILLKGSVSREKFAEIIKSTKEFGEPGFVWVDDLDIVYNPCITGDAIINVKDHGAMIDGEIISDGVEYTMTLKQYVDSYVSHDISPMVLSYDIKTGKKKYCRVTAAQLTRLNTDVITIELEDGKIVKCTPDHRIFTTNRGYVEAKDLTSEDDVKTV